MAPRTRTGYPHNGPFVGPPLNKNGKVFTTFTFKMAHARTKTERGSHQDQKIFTTFTLKVTHARNES